MSSEMSNAYGRVYSTMSQLLLYFIPKILSINQKLKPFLISIMPALHNLTLVDLLVNITELAILYFLFAYVIKLFFFSICIAYLLLSIGVLNESNTQFITNTLIQWTKG
jgi:hypothetical protein